MRWRAAEVAGAVGGTLVGADAAVDGVAIDSRALRAGQLFVSVVSARDGHDFVADALAAGASAYLTSRDPVGGTAIVVDDTAAALTTLGSAARDRVRGPVVGVTGSVGKTSTKDLLGAVLARRWTTAASPGSFNNELGVPLTFADAPDGVEAVVAELGARGHGHIEHLCTVARPTAGIVTAVAAAHTEHFGHLDDVARAKGELVAALPPDGVAVLNAADRRVWAMRTRTAARVVGFGAGGDVVADELRLDDELRVSFTLRSPWGSAPVRLAASGAHQASNALGAAAAGLALGVPLDDVAAGLGEARLSRWRMEVARTPAGAVVVNDAYNANPASTVAALEALAALDAARRVAVLGPMAELGAESRHEHLEVAAVARALGVAVIAVGTDEYGIDPVTGVEEALDAVGPVGAGDAVLVKGSRVAGLERVAAALLDGASG